MNHAPSSALRLFLLSLVSGAGLICTACPGLGETPYEPNWDSLSEQRIPDWLKDAKFGVYTHWGVYSVPAHGGPDYVKNLYGGAEKDVKGVYSYHTKKFGDLSEFGYKDFIPQFTAPRFNAEAWVGLMHKAGAKFGGICLVHHDGFLLWDSKVSRWNSKRVGPKRDIYGEIAEAVHKRSDMKLLATFHHGRSFGYCTGFMDRKVIPEEAKAWDIFDPNYADFYTTKLNGGSAESFAADWQAKITEVVDNYQPDLIWFDGLRSPMRKGHPPEAMVREVIADYFNKAQISGQEVTICNKHAKEFNFPDKFGLLCYENGRDMPRDVQPWFLIDRAIGYPWCYVHDKEYPDGAEYHVKSIVDLVSRGGIFLLSLTPKGDGSIPEEEQQIMRGIGRWLKINGPAIYGTRPWTCAGEGPAEMMILNESRQRQEWNYGQPFTAQDIRFTTKGDTLYAMALNWPEDGKIVVTSLAAGSELFPGEISSVVLLGAEESLTWQRTAKGLEIMLPDTPPCEFAFSFQIN